MTDLPNPKKLAVAAGLSAGKAKSGAMVAVSSRVVADGFIDLAGVRHAHMTLVVRPVAPSEVAVNQVVDVDLASWPSKIIEKHFKSSGSNQMTTKIRILPIPGSGLSRNTSAADIDQFATEIGATTVDANVHWGLDPATGMKVDAFWQSMMSPEATEGDHSFWHLLLRALRPTPLGNVCAVLPTPHHAAALAFTLSRGKMVLDALAGPSSPLAKQRNRRQTTRHDRPWHRREQHTKIASLNVSEAASSVRNISPDEDEYWMEPYRTRTVAFLTGDRAAPYWPGSRTIADMILAGGEAAAELVDQLHAAHHLTTPEGGTSLFCATPEQELAVAQRRLGALLSLPTLQRLFSFAFDIFIEDKKIQDALRNMRLPAAADSLFILLAPIGGDGSTWTLARYQPASDLSKSLFLPASWDELEKKALPSIAMGLRNLSATDADGHARYDIVTIDPPLATESSINHAARGQGKGAAIAPASDGIPLLHNGGFRIVELPDSCVAQAIALTEQQRPVPVQDAEALKIGDRLMIGLKTKTGIHWRSPSYRVAEFKEPTADRQSNWVEAELARRIHSFGEHHRLALDAVTSVSAFQMRADDAKPPGENSEDDADPATKQAIRIIADNTIALWGSDPAGVPPPEFREEDKKSGKQPKAITRKTVAVVQELDITRHFSAPTSLKQHPPEFLSPSLRFGWPYFAVIAPVFDGGSSVTAHQIGNIVSQNRDLALPPAQDNGGRRFLRHERVNAPMVLILESDVQELNRITPPQRGADMYVRTTSDGKANISRSRRLIVPPPVPLQFAMLHDILRHLGPLAAEPPQGLKGLSLLGKLDDTLPSRIRVGRANIEETSRSPYYPDPAASILMLGLKLPAETGLSELPFVEQAVSIPTGARTWPDSQHILPAWPDVLPVHIELKAGGGAVGEDDKQARIKHIGTRWLTGRERLVSKGEPGAAQVEAIEIELRHGEGLLLQAWYVPSINQLAEWFDAVEAAGVLALNDGIGDTQFHSDPNSACIGALKRLLDVKLGADVIDRAAKMACLGAGGLAAPPKQTIRTLATLVHRELLLRPIAALSTPQTMRVTHVVDNKLIPRPSFGRQVAVARRIFSGGIPGDNEKPIDAPSATQPVDAETPADFLNRVPVIDWGLGSNEEGATNVLIGGEINFDPASTVGLNIEIACAAPFGDALDPGTGRTLDDRLKNQWPDKFRPDKEPKHFGFTIGDDQKIKFPLKSVTALKLDGLSLPTSGKAGIRSYRLEALMAAAWGDAKEYGDALRAALPSVFSGTGARKLWLRAVPINRHTGLLSSEEPDRLTWPSDKDDFQTWLPSTARPAPPVIDHVHVALSIRPLKTVMGPNGSFTVGLEQATVLTVCHSRPFFSSGEGEKIALVLWPPGLFARGTRKDEDGTELFPSSPATGEEAEFYDEDLGPGGQYVTRWGANPLSGEVVDTGNYPTGPLIDPTRVSGDGPRVPRAYMPVPISDQNWAAPDTSKAAPQSGGGTGGPTASPSKTSAGEQAPTTFLAVALQTLEPHFDPVEELWYFNVALATNPLSFPRVRLGLVRYQANAREDDVPTEGREPVRLRVSTPVKEWVKPLPGRRATATCNRRSDGFTDVTVIVDGPSAVWQTGEDDMTPIRPQVMVEVIRGWKRNEVWQEEVINDGDGAQASCSAWSTSESDMSSRGLFRAIRDGYSWTCMFTVRSFGDDDGFCVVVRENHKGPRASKKGEAKIGNTGPNFVARIPLRVRE